MDDPVPFASRDYCLLLLLIAFSRGMDFLSTWVATPNLVLEGNPLAKKLGWRWGILLNVAICFAVAFEPLIAIAISTTSLLVAARNFQSAWLMRSLGEEFYRDWHVARIQETSLTVYLLCLAGNTLLTAAIGTGLVCFSSQRWIPVAIGLGIVAYAVAVAFYTSLAVWRIRRSAPRGLRRTGLAQIQFANGIVSRTMELKETDELKVKN
jgi:hypothetical protein